MQNGDGKFATVKAESDLNGLIVLSMRLNQCGPVEGRKKLLDALRTDRVRLAIQEALYNAASK